MFPSFSYGGSVLSHLEKVQRLPADVQVDIAKRIDSYIKLARAANDKDLLAPLALGASQSNQPGGQLHNGPAMGCTGNCRGMVLCHDQPVQGLPRSIGRESNHQRD